jgi:hypothetical protein
MIKYVILCCLSFFGEMMLAQSLTMKGATASSGTFTASGLGAYSGVLLDVYDVYRSGLIGDSIKSGDKFIDAKADIYTVTSVANSGRDFCVIVLQQDGLAPHRSPIGGGVVWQYKEPGYIPVMPANPGRISQFLQAKIIIHNTVVATNRGGGTVSLIAAKQDTTTITEPKEGDLALFGETGILFRASSFWVERNAGPPGEDGENGTLILSGFGVPNTNLGVVGDFYFDLDARRLYGPKNLSGWTGSISLIGLTGPAGPSGSFILGYGLTGEGTEAAPAKVDTLEIATRARVLVTILEMGATLVQVTATAGQSSIVAPFQINTDRPEQITRNGQILTLGGGYTRSGTTYNFIPVFVIGEEIQLLIYKQ